MPSDLVNLANVVDIDVSKPEELKNYIANNPNSVRTYLTIGVNSQITREDYLQGSLLNLSLGRVCLVKSRGHNLATLAQMGEEQKEKICSDLYQCLLEHDDVFKEELGTFQELRAISNNVGYRTLLRFCCREDIAPHDMNNASTLLLRMLRSANLLKTDGERSPVMRNLMEQIAKTKTLQGNRNPYVYLIYIAEVTECNIESCWAGIQVQRNKSSGQIIKAKLEGMDTIADIFFILE